MSGKQSLCTFDAQIDFFVDLSWKYIKLAILGDLKFLDQILADFGHIPATGGQN